MYADHCLGSFVHFSLIQRDLWLFRLSRAGLRLLGHCGLRLQEDSAPHWPAGGRQSTCTRGIGTRAGDHWAVPGPGHVNLFDGSKISKRGAEIQQTQVSCSPLLERKGPVCVSVCPAGGHGCCSLSVLSLPAGGDQNCSVSAHTPPMGQTPTHRYRKHQLRDPNSGSLQTSKGGCS